MRGSVQPGNPSQARPVGRTCRPQGLPGQARVASFLGSGSPWPLLQRTAMPLDFLIELDYS